MPGNRNIKTHRIGRTCAGCCAEGQGSVVTSTACPRPLGLEQLPSAVTAFSPQGLSSIARLLCLIPARHAPCLLLPAAARVAPGSRLSDPTIWIFVRKGRVLRCPLRHAPCIRHPCRSKPRAVARPCQTKPRAPSGTRRRSRQQRGTAAGAYRRAPSPSQPLRARHSATLRPCAQTPRAPAPGGTRGGPA